MTTARSGAAIIRGNTILGRDALSSYAIQLDISPGALTGIDPNLNPTIEGNIIRDFAVGILLGNATTSRVVNNDIRSCTNNGIEQIYNRTDSAAALHIISGNTIADGFRGIRMVHASGGTVPAGSGYRGLNIITNMSGAQTELTNGFTYNPAGQTF